MLICSYICKLIYLLNLVFVFSQQMYHSGRDIKRVPKGTNSYLRNYGKVLSPYGSQHYCLFLHAGLYSQKLVPINFCLLGLIRVQADQLLLLLLLLLCPCF